MPRKFSINLRLRDIIKRKNKNSPYRILAYQQPDIKVQHEDIEKEGEEKILQEKLLSRTILVHKFCLQTGNI